MTSTPTTESQKKAKTPWHPLFYRLMVELLVSTGMKVRTEPQSMTDPPRADLLLLGQRGQGWTDEQKARLPDGIRDSKAQDVLIEFKYTESLNADAIQQALGYDYFYRDSQKLKLREVETFALSAKTPSERTLRRLGYQATEWPGIYRSQNPILSRVSVVVLSRLRNEPHNAFVKCFATQKRAKEAAFRLIRESVVHELPEPLYSLLSGLYELWFKQIKGESMSEKLIDAFDITPEHVMEMGKEIGDLLIRAVPVEERLAGLTPEERLIGLKPEEILSTLKPEEMVANLTLEERLADMPLEKVESYLVQRRKQQSAKNAAIEGRDSV